MNTKLKSTTQGYVNAQLQSYKTRVLGGSLIITKNGYPWCVIERGANGKPQVTETHGDWTQEEQEYALSMYEGSEASER